jgi:hypothetical protein
MFDMNDPKVNGVVVEVSRSLIAGHCSAAFAQAI